MTTGYHDGADAAGREPAAAGHSPPSGPETAPAGSGLGSWQYDPATGDGYWSREMFLLVGRDRALGRPPDPEFFELFHPDDRAALLATQNPAPWSGDHCEVHLRTNPALGPVRLLHMVVRAVRDRAGRLVYLAGTLQDETKRKQAEDTMREREARYRHLFEQNPAPMLIYERSTLRLLAVNEAFIRHYGYSRAEAQALRVTDLYPEEEKTRIAALIAKLHGYANVGEWHHRRRDGSMMTIVATSHDLDYEGHAARVVVIIDITERKRAEEMLREAHADLERRVQERTQELAVARDRAESADRLKSAFLASMSHELRTPLNSIIGFTGILLQELAGPLNPEQRKQLGMVQGSARHLHALINDVLDFSRIAADQLELRTERFEVRALIAGAVDLVRLEAERKGLRLQVEVPPGLPPLESDRRRCGQVLLNLVSNAVKFTDRGEVVIAAGLVPDFRPEGARAVGACAAAPAVRLRVCDTGVGIKPEDLAALFQAFRQIDAGLARQHGGTGLGLAVSRRLADRLGGEIAVESTWGRGSVFSFTLPLTPPAGAAAAAGAG